MSKRNISILILMVLLLGISVNLNAQSSQIKASYKITLVNPDRMLFHINAEFDFPDKLDSAVFRIEDTDNHYTEGYGQFVKEVKLTAPDSSEIEIVNLESNRWLAQNLRGKYSLNYYISVQHLSQPSQYGVDETPFFLGASGILIGSAMILYPELEPRLLPKDFIIEFDLSKNMLALLPYEKVAENKYRVPSLSYIHDAYWAVGKYDTLLLGDESNPLKVGLQRNAFNFTNDQMIGHLRNIWAELDRIFKTSPEFHPYLFISKFPFSDKTPEYVNSGASSPGSINILLDQKLTPELLSNYFGLFVYHLYTQYIPITFFPENRIDNSWMIDGTANYYQLVMLMRCGIITQDQFLDRILFAYEHYSTEFDRRNISVRVARDVPAASSYVSAAEMLTACAVDLRLRSGARRASSLDDVIAALSKRFKGSANTFSDQQFYELVDTLSGQFLRPFIDSCLNLKTKIDLPGLMAKFGVGIEVIPDGKPDLGMAFNTFTDLTIANINRSGPADEAGLMVGDRIIKVNGKEFATIDPMIASLDGKKTGDKIKIEYLRGKKRQKATLRLGGLDKYAISKMKSPTAARTERWNRLVSSSR
jgi:predicted metalloprotease with PDZ domain